MPSALPSPTQVAPSTAQGQSSPVELPDAIFADAHTAIPALLKLEREATQTADLHLLAQLWTPDGRIIDGRTTAEPEDDYRWQERKAILDRYVVAVFPTPPPLLTDDTLAQIAAQLVIDGSQATLNHGVDRWVFIRHDNRWWLHELRYN